MVTEKEAKKNRDSAIDKGIPVEKEKKIIFLRHCNKTGNTFFVERLISASFQMPLVTRILPANTS